MLAFALCLVFNAHPYFWLTDTELNETFDNMLELKLIASAKHSIENTIRVKLTDPRMTTFPEFAGTMNKLIEQDYQRLYQAELGADRKRTTRRIAALFYPTELR